MSESLSARLESLKASLIAEIPCVPETPEVRASLQVMPLDELVHTYSQWMQRLIRPAPRFVIYSRDFWTERAKKHSNSIEGIASLISNGEVLNSLLSSRAARDGYAPREARPKQTRGIDWDKMDFAINTYEAHHLHLREKRSNDLLYVVFSRDFAAIILFGNHKSFHSGELENAVARWKAESGETINGALELERNTTPAERTALARQGVGCFAKVGSDFVLSGASSSAGTSFRMTRHADQIYETLRLLDAQLAQGLAYKFIPSEYAVKMPNPKWKWHLHYNDLILVEETSKTGFLLAPGPN